MRGLQAAELNESGLVGKRLMSTIRLNICCSGRMTLAVAKVGKQEGKGQNEFRGAWRLVYDACGAPKESYRLWLSNARCFVVIERVLMELEDDVCLNQREDVEGAHWVHSWVWGGYCWWKAIRIVVLLIELCIGSRLGLERGGGVVDIGFGFWPGTSSISPVSPAHPHSTKTAARCSSIHSSSSPSNPLQHP